MHQLPRMQVSAGAFPAVHKLRKRGVKTAIISDFDTRLRELVQSYGMDRAFDEIICSAEVGAEKPDPRIFQAACDRLGVEPHEVGATSPILSVSIWENSRVLSPLPPAPHLRPLLPPSPSTAFFAVPQLSPP